jgi:hypothetical protein
MSRLSPDAAWKKILLDPKYSVKARVQALQQIPRPSLNLLRRLLSSNSTPRRLKLLAAEMYSLAMARRELLKHARQTEP